MKKPRRSTKEKIEAIAAACGGRSYPGYSGRCMFGAQCWGVVCSQFDVSEVKRAGTRAGLGAANTDSLGLDIIVYWPGATYSTTEKEGGAHGAAG